MTFEFQLSDRDFRQAWLAEYFRRPGLGLFRVIAGPAFIVVGLQMLRGDDPMGRGIGIAAILLGVWHLVRPFVLVRAMVRRRRASGAADARMRVSVDGSGIAVSDGKKETRLGWDAITGAGRGRDYFWFEIRKSARGTIPLRAVGDEAALTELFQSRGKWRSR
ncbi:MAG: hypothetical protein M3Y87_22050 [Myxococcota bacterium]|nr:hypothetical protein [Myxococcota bacterium]